MIWISPCSCYSGQNMPTSVVLRKKIPVCTADEDQGISLLSTSNAVAVFFLAHFSVFALISEKTFLCVSSFHRN